MLFPRMRRYSHGQCCPLGEPSKEIRILEIIDNTSDPIDCNLVKTPQGGAYAALSWCWGNLNQEFTSIRIIEKNLAYEFRIPKNLESAIRMLRSRKLFRVWIDYICIDQEDLFEKNFQVPMMFRIYGEAERVYVWLGEASDDSDRAMEFISGIISLGDFDHLISDKSAVREWRALSALIKRSWFSRRWIIQEIAVAQNATLLCGACSVDWKDFADAISLFNEVEKSTSKISEIVKVTKEFGHISAYLGTVSELSATKLVEETSNLSGWLVGKEREAQSSLEYLVSKLTTFDSSEPRDAVYALLAIAKDTTSTTIRLERTVIESWAYPEHITDKLINQLTKTNVSTLYHVDYTLPLSDVYVQFVKWTVDKSDKTRALDIICRPWAPEPTSSDFLSDDDDEEARDSRIYTGIQREEGDGMDTLPSWIQTVDKATFGTNYMGQKTTRLNADSLVGLPPRRIYSAAGTNVLTDNFRFEDGVTRYSQDERLNEFHYHSMFVEGFVLDEVRGLKYCAHQGNIPSGWLKLAGRKVLNGQLSDEFLRTMVADRSPAGENAPRYYPRLVDYAFKQAAPGDSLDTKDFVNWGSCSIVGDVLRRVQSSIWNRRLMRTKRDRRLGLAPEPTKSGDLICILYGCSVPVLLRKFAKTPKEVAEESRQRQEKKEKMEKEGRVEAAKKIWQVWKGTSARRKTGPSKQPGNLRRRKGAFARVDSQRKKQKQAGTTSNHTSQTAGREHADNPDESSSVNPNIDKKLVKLESDPNVYYQLIGECYVDGMMNGEALAGDHTSTLFEIR